MLDTVTTPSVDALAQSFLDGLSLFSQPMLQVLGFDLEDWEVHNIIRDIENFILSRVELVQFGCDFSVIGFL